MAFVHRAKRSTAVPSNTTPSALGPGSYYNPEVTSPTHHLRLSYAPFASSAERGIDDRFTSVEYTPGPGEYAHSSTLGGPSISTGFVSGVPRFGREPDPASIVPGPGTYGSVLGKWTKPNRTKAHGVQQRRGGVEWVKVSAPPSIPTPSQSFGYEENRAGELILQTPAQLPGHTGRGADQVGPGEYLSRAHEDILAHSQPKGFVEWSKSRTHRASEAQLKRAASQPGPGYYIQSERSEGTTRRGKKVSPFFASKVNRLRSADPSLKNPVPGPGSYGASSDFDRIASNFVPSSYQFFGSKTNRLVGGILQASHNPTPGPGTYQMKSSIKTIDPATQDPYAPSLAFKSTSQRFEKGANEQDQPGPGAYRELTNTSAELAKKVFGRNTSFGTTEQRFVEKSSVKAASGLGPASYEPRGTGAIRMVRKPHSVFVSTTKRFDAASGVSSQEEKQQQDRANQGHASAMESQPIGIGNEPTWGNMSKVSAPSSSFAMRQSRFDDRSVQKMQASSPAIGPGSYTTNPSNLYHTPTAVSSSFKSIGRSSAGLGGVYRKDDGPGPGAYTKEIRHDNSTLLTRSFNITIATD